jgi:MSHA type pilus biogenesis protein MshL
MSTTAIARTIIRASLIAVAFEVMACAGAAVPAHEVHTSVRVEPTPASASSASVQQQAATTESAPPPALPQLSSGNATPALSAAPERRISALDVKPGTPIATAVSELGAKFGLSVSVDPAVQGTVQANLRNVTLNQALEQLVTHNGAQYQLQGSVLRVVPIRMESRTFALDYVALSRVGAMSTVVQRRLSNNTGGISAGSANGLSANAGGIAAASGGDVLTAQSVADIWSDIRVALTGIMSAGQPRTAGNAEATGAAPAPGATGATTGPQASSTTFADGSVLIISPTAGLINVTAMPDKIAAIDKFLAEFQSSVLRQVMIQAKIVEVQLDQLYQFGIDWTVVTGSASQKSGVTLRSDPTVVTTGNTGNINFTFTGGTTTINAVVNALSTQGEVNVLSNEQTSALNNQRAIFQVTTDEVFFSVNRIPLLGPNGGVASIQSSINAQQVSVGVVLDVLPQISADNVLTMDIRPAVTSILDTTSITLSDGTSASAPVIARREGDTIARLRAGETMMIGGLVQTRKERSTGGIPLLKDIPLIGKAFQHIKEHNVRSELVVFLTPTIISGQPAAGR